ncbi:MAG: hypothetical protein JNM89_11745 [Hyphomicrobiaceae bacterium]|nr:hypothetical protein [Hyphomicrobiaceae bacterium]
MKIITLIALLTVTLLAFLDVFPKGSVGGAMSLALLFVAAAIAVGLHDAWSNRRGVLGWIVSIIVSFVGGLFGAGVGAVLVENAIMLVRPEGALMQTHHPMLYLSLNGQMICTLLGAWLALALVNRFRMTGTVGGA